MKPHHPRKFPSPQPGAAKPARPSPSSVQSSQLSKPTHWDNVADWYDTLVGDQGSEYHQHVVLPGIRRMLQVTPRPLDPSTPKVLDLACGQGILCRTLAKEGFAVTGLDASPALIDVARDRTAAEVLHVTYLVADATKLSPLPSPLTPGSFDAITCVLAIQNITPLSPVWQACQQLLKPDGHLILVLMHPCFRIPRQSAWHWEDRTQTQSRLITQYLTSSKTEIQMHPGSAPSQTTLTFHRPLQAYINTLASAGLLIDHLEEWASHKKSQPGPKAAALDRSRKEIPMFLALRARKS